MELIKLKNISKIYQMGEVETKALDNVSLGINKGEFVAILGASGSGKSTLMNLLGCLDRPTLGQVFINSKKISNLSEEELADIRGKTIGFIFQQYNLFPNLTVLGNVMLPLDIHDVDETTGKKNALNVITQLGLGNKTANLPSQLSGGQQQRVSIARALVNDPHIILADEPTGALDSKTGHDVLNILKDLWRNENKTIIMITHDLNLAKHAKRIITLHDGKIISDEENKEVKK
jgi:putative ABC transport system ATP-binding protein